MKPLLLWLRCWLWYGGHEWLKRLETMTCLNCGRERQSPYAEYRRKERKT
jgi:hypothetical protein